MTFDEARRVAEQAHGCAIETTGLEDAEDFCVGLVRDPQPIDDIEYFVSKTSGAPWEGVHFDLRAKLAGMRRVSSDESH
jgi:hypothetical protein